MDFTQTKPPPHNHEAEQSVLGAILLNNSVINDISEILKPDHFYREQHRLIYQAALDLHNDNQPVDIITLADKLKADGNLEKAGGYTGVATLANLVPTAANAVHYAKIVHDKALTRAMIQKAAKILQQGYSEDFDSVEEYITTAQAEICEVGGQTKGGLIHVKDLVIDRITAIEQRKSMGGVTGIPTGHATLDAWTAGWQPTDLIILAARPSMGKTSYAMQLSAEAGVIHSKKVANFSLEMSKEQLIEKWFCNLGRVDAQRVRVGRLNDDDWNNIRTAANKLWKSGLYICDDPGLNVIEIKNKCRRMKQRDGLDLVVIDYLQLISPHKKFQTKNEEVGAISRELKMMAKELNVPVICLSQLSRAVEQRADKVPMLSDLRDSGGIEQDADVICFLYREEYYLKEKSKRKGIADLIIAKQRQGKTGKVELYFQKQYTRFEALVKEDDFK